MVQDFRKANWEGSKLGILISGKNTYEMWDIFKSLLDKFTKQFIPLKKKGIIRKSNLSG